MANLENAELKLHGASANNLNPAMAAEVQEQIHQKIGTTIVRVHEEAHKVPSLAQKQIPADAETLRANQQALSISLGGDWWSSEPPALDAPDMASKAKEVASANLLKSHTNTGNDLNAGSAPKPGEGDSLRGFSGGMPPAGPDKTNQENRKTSDTGNSPNVLPKLEIGAFGHY